MRDLRPGPTDAMTDETHDPTPFGPDGRDGRDDTGPDVDWWHRDHPVFVPLCGFFTGLLLVLVVPAAFAAALDALFAPHTVTDLFPLVLVLLAVPLVLVARERTRRFGLYLALGMVATAAVVLGVGAVAFWLISATA